MMNRYAEFLPSFLTDPFFWALISKFGLVEACSVVGSKKVGRNHQFALFWALSLVTFMIGPFYTCRTCGNRYCYLNRSAEEEVTNATPA